MYAFWFYQQSFCLTFLSTAGAELHGWSSCIVPKRPLLKPYLKLTRGLLSSPDGMAGTSVFMIILLCPFPTSFPGTMYLREFWLLLMEKSFWVTMENLEEEGTVSPDLRISFPASSFPGVEGAACFGWNNLLRVYRSSLLVSTLSKLGQLTVLISYSSHGCCYSGFYHSLRGWHLQL